MDTLGLIFAFLALISWTFGDFFIQKSVRRVGTPLTLLYICGVGGIVLIPFILNDLFSALKDINKVVLLTLAFLMSLLSALPNLKALKLGKLSVVEPIFAAELPITVLLSIVLAGEHLSGIQAVAILFIFLGLVLTSLNKLDKLRMLERGVLLALLTAVLMGATNFLYGFSSSRIDPLLTFWFVHFFLAIFALFWVVRRKELIKVVSGLKNYKKIVIGEVVFDNLAWSSFALSASLIPISIATAISESYIGLAALLGIYSNKEKLTKHQIAGVVITFASVVFLALI